MAMIQSWYPILDDCMAVPCLTEEYFLQSLQRWGIVGWEARSLTFFDPQRTHTMPSGQRFSMNHYSVGVVREYLEQLLQGNTLPEVVARSLLWGCILSMWYREVVPK